MFKKKHRTKGFNWEKEKIWNREMQYDCQVELRERKSPIKVSDPKYKVRQVNIPECITPTTLSYYIQSLISQSIHIK